MGTMDLAKYADEYYSDTTVGRIKPIYETEINSNDICKYCTRNDEDKCYEEDYTCFRGKKVMTI
jgi:hypothetical protein